MRTTVDPILRGRLHIEQPEKGYRFNIDAILLAAFARRLKPRELSRVVDLGAGCGVIGLLLGLDLDGTKIVLVESQEELAALCRRNLDRNGMGDRGEVRCEDLRFRRWASASGSSLVVCNPPFFPLGRGRLNADPMIAQARHELVGSLAELLAATALGLNGGDVFALIHDARRGDEVVGTLRSLGLHLRARRLVLPLPGRSPRRVLICAQGRKVERGWAKDAIDRPPLILHDAPGLPSKELAAMLGDAARAGALFTDEEGPDTSSLATPGSSEGKG